MTKRVISTVVLWMGLAAILALLHRWGGVLLLVAISVLAHWECLRLVRAPQGLAPALKSQDALAAVLSGLVLLVGVYLLPASQVERGAHFAWVLGAFCGLYLLVPFTADRQQRDSMRANLAMFLYVPWQLQFYVLLLHGYETLWAPVWVAAVAKFNDAGALLCGRWLGRRKLASRLSPGKTVEGAIGGLLTGALVGLLLWALSGGQERWGFSAPTAFAVALLLGPVSIVSDLSASWLKRRAQVKDSGLAIPGIGGVLDLADSLLLTAPVAYLLLMGLRG